MKYFVRSGAREVEVDVDGETVRVGGREYHATLSRIPGTPLVQVARDGHVFLVDARSVARGAWQIARGGDRWEIEVIDERTRHIRSLTGEAEPRGPVPVKAPMPGLVLRVTVAVGDHVLPGTGLVVLEAMKMENELRATAAGAVKAVRVEAGQTVEKGQVLIEFDAE